jgi:putative hydrolase of the HAD superfamily
MRPRVVFFDFGGTLAEPIVDPLDVWLELVHDLSLPGNRDDLERALAAANAWFQTAVFDHHGRTAELWRQYDRLVLASLGERDSRERLVTAIQERFDRVAWSRVYPETRPVLEGLRDRGCTLHIISNATDEILGRIKDLGLAGYFESITYSQEAGANKPDPAPFRLALRRADCAPGDAIHVGNTYEEDIVGARGAGITPVLVDRDDARPAADCLRVRDLHGVLDLA